MTVYSLNTLPQHIKDTPVYQQLVDQAEDEDELDNLDYDDKLISINYLDLEDPKFFSRTLKIAKYWQIDYHPLIVYQYLDDNRDSYDVIKTFLEKKLKEFPTESSLYNHFLEFLYVDHDHILRWACVTGSYHAIEYGFSIGNKLEDKALFLLCNYGFFSCLQLIFTKVDKEEYTIF